MLKMLSIVTVALGLASCAPIPHFERDTPPLAGVFLSNGAPAQGKMLRVVAGNSKEGCTEFWREETTNERGEFSFPAKTRFNFFMILGIAHKFYEWGVCVEDQGQFYPAIRFKQYTTAGIPGAGPSNPLVITCEVSASRLSLQPTRCLQPTYTSDAKDTTCSCQVTELKGQ